MINICNAKLCKKIFIFLSGGFVVLAAFVFSLHLLATGNISAEEGGGLGFLVLGFVTICAGLVFVFFVSVFIVKDIALSKKLRFYLTGYPVYVSLGYGTLVYENIFNGILLDGFIKTVYIEYMGITYIIVPIIFSLYIFKISKRGRPEPPPVSRTH